jgi:hypothetical protein
MISIASTLIHPGRGSLASVSPIKSLMSSVRMTSASVSSSEENCLSKRKLTQVPRRASGKAERSESVLRSRGKKWCCHECKSSECCEHESDLRTTAGIRVGWVRGRRDTPCGRVGGTVVREYALDQLERKRSPLGPIACVDQSGRVIDSSSLANSMRRSSCTTLSTMNITNLRSVVHGGGRHHSRPKFMLLETHKEGRSIGQGRGEGTLNESTYVCE